MIIIQEKPLNIGYEYSKFTKSNNDLETILVFSSHASCTAQIVRQEPYMPFTEYELRKIEANCQKRWPLVKTQIIHRYGNIDPTEPILFVAVASQDRAHAYSASKYLSDHLRTDAPFWKKEIKDGEETWVEPSSSDRKSRKDWD